MIPEGPSDQTRAIAVLVEAKIAEMGPRRFGSKYGIRSSLLWGVYSLAEDGYSATQIAAIYDERAAESRRDLLEIDPDMISAENVQFQIDTWEEIKAAIMAITA